MSQSAAFATADVTAVAQDPWRLATAVPIHAAPDRPELGTAMQPLVVSSAWWLLIAMAVIHRVRG
jgi:hypothetical protein